MNELASMKFYTAQWTFGWKNARGRPKSLTSYVVHFGKSSGMLAGFATSARVTEFKNFLLKHE